MLLGREEYDDLVKRPRRTPETHAPRPAAPIAADYTVSPGRAAEMTGGLTVDVLEDGLHALPLDLGSVGLLTRSPMAATPPSAAATTAEWCFSSRDLGGTN